MAADSGWRRSGIRAAAFQRTLPLFFPQALPQLPKDVLCVHADVVQRSSLAQHNPSDRSQPPARCGEKGHLEGAVAHHNGAHTGGCIRPCFFT